MSPRSIRRASERKARKLQQKQERFAASTNTPPLASGGPTLEDEFSPEFIAEARAMRERVAARVADEAAPLSEPKTRRETNRANAAHSTGPVSPAGKLASSRNSLKHGLASGQIIIPGEDPAAYESLLESLLAEHQPASITEEMLVHEMAQSWWLTQRALRLQNDCFTVEGIDEKRLALFLRYQTTHERAFHKALNTLIRLQKERHKVEIGFVSQSHTTADPKPGFVSQSHTTADPKPGFVSQSHTTADPKPGFVSQSHTTADPKPGFVSQNGTQPDESLPDPALQTLKKEEPARQAA